MAAPFWPTPQPRSRRILSHCRKSLISAAEASCAILLLALLTQWTATPLLMTPFAATSILLFAFPHSPLAQPRHVLGSHLLAALTGLTLTLLWGPSPYTMALGTGTVVALMLLLKIVHPPATGVPIVMLLSGVRDWHFLLFPVLTGCLLLLAIAFIANNLRSSQRWPLYW